MRKSDWPLIIWKQRCKIYARKGKYETSATVTELLLCQIQVVGYRIPQQKDMVQINCMLDSSAVVVVPALMPVSVSVSVSVSFSGMARRHLGARAVMARVLPARV